MSRGLAVSVWKSLEINENICDMMQHQLVGPSSTKFLILLVRTAGLEPAQGFPQGILSPLRLPFRHVRESGQLYDAEKADNHTRSADAHNYTMSGKANNYITSAKAIIREADNYPTSPRSEHRSGLRRHRS
jgi:hypothetical protein